MPSEVFFDCLLLLFSDDVGITLFKTFGGSEHCSDILVFHVTDISACSSGDRDNLYSQQLEASAVGDAILQDVRLLVEGKLDLATAVDRNVLVSNRSSFSVYDDRFVVILPSKLDFVLTLCNFFLRLRLECCTLRILVFRLSPFQAAGSVRVKLVSHILIDNSHQGKAKLTRFQYSLIPFENDRLFSLKNGTCH